MAEQRTGSVGTKIAVGVITAVLVLYFIMSFSIAIPLIRSGDGVSIAIGIGMIVLAVIGAALIWREIMFGLQAEHLLKRMLAEGELPEDDLPKRPSGRPEREAADADFERWRDEVNERPEDWRAWYRLALAYRASGDTARARAATRNAITLEKRARSSRA